MKPIHKHDCDKCEFVGIVNTVNGLSDLYKNCQQFGSKYIIRYGLDGEYATTDELKMYLTPIKD